jgi:hypothetical protein
MMKYWISVFFFLRIVPSEGLPERKSSETNVFSTNELLLNMMAPYLIFKQSRTSPFRGDGRQSR